MSFILEKNISHEYNSFELLYLSVIAFYHELHYHGIVLINTIQTLFLCIINKFRVTFFIMQANCIIQWGNSVSKWLLSKRVQIRYLQTYKIG